eukprot:107145-Prorocentrum_minimum.AAC.1
MSRHLFGAEAGLVMFLIIFRKTPTLDELKLGGTTSARQVQLGRMRCWRKNYLKYSRAWTQTERCAS